MLLFLLKVMILMGDRHGRHDCVVLALAVVGVTKTEKKDQSRSQVFVDKFAPSLHTKQSEQASGRHPSLTPWTGLF